MPRPPKPVAKPPLGALDPRFGAKRTQARRIVPYFGAPARLVDAFCGSLAIVLALDPMPRYVTACDLDGNLTHLARVIQDEQLYPRLRERLEGSILVEADIRQAHDRLRDTPPAAYDPVDRAYDYLYWSWLIRNGSAGTEDPGWAYCIRHSNTGGDPVTRWQGVARSLPWWHERLRSVEVLNRDGLTVIERLKDEATTTIYCDPPYVDEGARYLHKFDEKKHRALAAAVARFQRARVVMSYYDHPLLDELYPAGRWRRVEQTVPKNSANQRGRTGGVQAAELLILNPAVLEPPCTKFPR